MSHSYKKATFSSAFALLLLIFLSQFSQYGSTFFVSLVATFIVGYELFIPLKILKLEKIPPQWYGIRIWPMYTNYFWKDVGRTLMLSAIVLPLFSTAYYLFANQYLSYSLNKIHLTVPPHFFNLLIGFIVGAVAEEVFYRGFLQTRLIAIFKKNFYFSIILTNTFFAFAHFVGTNNPSRLLTFFPGLLFSYLAFKGKTLTGAVIFHILCNLLAQFLYWSIVAI